MVQRITKWSWVVCGSFTFVNWLYNSNNWEKLDTHERIHFGTTSTSQAACGGLFFVFNLDYQRLTLKMTCLVTCAALHSLYIHHISIWNIPRTLYKLKSTVDWLVSLSFDRRGRRLKHSSQSANQFYVNFFFAHCQRRTVYDFFHVALLGTSCIEARTYRRWHGSRSQWTRQFALECSWISTSLCRFG